MEKTFKPALSEALSLIHQPRKKKKNSFDMPEGSGYHFVPDPMAQFSLGLPGDTQVTLRYSPEVVIENDYRLRVFGIGGMVGLNQLFFAGQLPIDLSIQAGTMDLSTNAQFNVLPPKREHIENIYPDSHLDGRALTLIQIHSLQMYSSEKSSLFYHFLVELGINMHQQKLPRRAHTHLLYLLTVIPTMLLMEFKVLPCRLILH